MGSSLRRGRLTSTRRTAPVRRQQHSRLGSRLHRVYDHISIIVMTLSLSFTKIKMKTFSHNITQSMDPSPPWPDGEVGLGGSRLRKQDLILQWRTRGIWGLSGEECAQGMEEWEGGSGECSPGMEEHGVPAGLLSMPCPSFQAPLTFHAGGSPRSYREGRTRI